MHIFLLEQFRMKQTYAWASLNNQYSMPHGKWGRWRRHVHRKTQNLEGFLYNMLSYRIQKYLSNILEGWNYPLHTISANVFNKTRVRSLGLSPSPSPLAKLSPEPVCGNILWWRLADIPSTLRSLTLFDQDPPWSGRAEGVSLLAILSNLGKYCSTSLGT